MAQNNIPITEVFWTLIDKADRRFIAMRDMPRHGRTSYDQYFNKVFKIYTQLWKLQQEHRQLLMEAGLKRWEIGEIASRIGQLFYGQYLRTSEANFLSESYIFYEAILSREYFKNVAPSPDLNLAKKQLRCLSRFLTVCLVSNRREMMQVPINQLKTMVDECKKTFPETDFKEWKQAVQEIVRFVQVDTPFLNIRPLRYSTVLDSHPDSSPIATSFAGKRSLRLREAILSSYHHNEVKFSELTLDTFRMLQCLEWEPSGSFYQPSPPTNFNVSDASHSGVAGFNQLNCSKDLTDPSLPPNPRKAILYHPAVTHFMAVMATVSEELPSDGILLIYLSASGKQGQSVSFPSWDPAELAVGDLQSCDRTSATSSIKPSMSQRDCPGVSQIRGNQKSHESGLWMGSRGNRGSNCICPTDLIPFTRRPLFLIIDSDSSQAFKVIHGAEMGEPAAILLSPSSPSPAIRASDITHNASGSQFTRFLTAPLQAFCLLLGLSESDIGMDVYNKADELLSSSLEQWALTLANSDRLDPVWGQILCDPFLRRLLMRFIFCRAVIALYAPTHSKNEFLPECLPPLPQSVDPLSTTCQTAVSQIASSLGSAKHFKFSAGIHVDSAGELGPESAKE